MQFLNSMSSIAAPPPRSLVLIPWNMTSKFLSFPSRMTALCQWSPKFCSLSCHTFVSPFSVCIREINTKEEKKKANHSEQKHLISENQLKTNTGTLIISTMCLTSSKQRHINLLQCFLEVLINLFWCFQRHHYLGVAYSGHSTSPLHAHKILDNILQKTWVMAWDAPPTFYPYSVII